ncbi:hypothetical protein NKR23_g1922 [Pleurostoma richardsiae]|uniref:Uncharacterized protein n=1 Tax=Pleurostoma richardsiae TaxID=41990 RepID=A0AA38RYB2_9PEZI|nr:hypothetical protein NKR23_g1922 [Pleurostoma richardsiae]
MLFPTRHPFLLESIEALTRVYQEVLLQMNEPANTTKAQTTTLLEQTKESIFLFKASVYTPGATALQDSLKRNMRHMRDSSPRILHNRVTRDSSNHSTRHLLADRHQHQEELLN